jgi:hypothetical protein
LLLYSANQMGLFQKGNCASSTASSRSNNPSSLLPLEPHCHTLRRLYTSSKVQCLTSVSYKSSFWYPHPDASVLSACLKLLKAPLACMQDC